MTVRNIPLPLPGLTGHPKDSAHTQPEQLALMGQPQPIRVPERLWRSWLNDPLVVARFEAKRYRRGDDQCWIWIGGVSSTGHGSFRAASLPGPTRRGTVPAHLFAYQLAHGVIPRLGWSNVEDCVICHRCDFTGCTNPAHLRLGTNATNRFEYLTRRRNIANPLADVRGAARRTRSIATAIKTSLANGEDPTTIETRIFNAEFAGRPLTLW